MMKQKVLVCGGRDYVDRETLFQVLDTAHQANPIELLVHGGARGADRFAQEWAEDRGVCSKAYPADWSAGKSAGPIRNQLMLDQEKPHLVIAFQGGRGTADMVDRAYRAKVPIVKVRPVRRVGL